MQVREENSLAALGNEVTARRPIYSSHLFSDPIWFLFRDLDLLPLLLVFARANLFIYLEGTQIRDDFVFTVCLHSRQINFIFHVPCD